MIRKLLRYLLLLAFVMQGMTSVVVHADQQRHCDGMQASHQQHSECCTDGCATKNDCASLCLQVTAVPPTAITISTTQQASASIALTVTAIRSLTDTPPYPPPIA